MSENTTQTWSEADVDRLLADFLPDEMPAELREIEDETSSVISIGTPAATTMPRRIRIGSNAWTAIVTVAMSACVVVAVFVSAGDPQGISDSVDVASLSPVPVSVLDAPPGEFAPSNAVEAKSLRFSYTAGQEEKETSVVKTPTGPVEMRKKQKAESLKVLDSKSGKEIDFQGLQIEIEVFGAEDDEPEKKKP